MPYPNEHACRLRDPDEMQDGSFRRSNGAREHDGKPYDVIQARPKGEESLVDQSYRYGTETWDRDEARSHCREHDGAFEPASGNASSGRQRPGRVLSAVYGQPWLITPEGLQQIAAVAEREGDVQSLQTRDGIPAGPGGAMEYRDRVAVVSITGPIFRYANLFTDISGATSLEMAAKDIQAALDDPGIEAVVLNIDSPGGQAAGVNELADTIYRARSQKPIKAYAGFMAASSAYWIASAASELWLDATAAVGSIGVRMGLRRADRNEMEIISTVSPRKRLDPDTDEGRQQALQYVDALAKVFVASVARNRSVSEDTVLSDFGRGDVLVGERAVDAGMADRLGSLEELIAELQPIDDGGNRMDYSTLKSEHAELFEQVKEEGRTEARQEKETALEQARQTGLDEGRGTAMQVVGTLLGEEAQSLVKQALDANLSVEQLQAAKSLFGAGSEGAASSSQQRILEELHKAHGHGVGPARAQGQDGEPQDFEQAVARHQQDKECSRGEAIKAVAEQYPQLHQDWLEKHNQ